MRESAICDMKANLCCEVLHSQKQQHILLHFQMAGVKLEHLPVVWPHSAVALGCAALLMGEEGILWQRGPPVSLSGAPCEWQSLSEP